MDLAGKRVLLTGATGGIGGAAARALAARGASVVVTGRRAEPLEALAAELGGRAVVVDLADPDAPARLVEEAGEVDALVANAGLPASGELDSFSVAEIDRALTVNLRAPVLLARLLSPAMVARGAGHLVFVSSLSGRTAAPHSSLYSATKFGLRGFALSLRQDLAQHGVGVSCVLPGFVRDAGMFADSGASLPPRRRHDDARRGRRGDRPGDRAGPGRGRRRPARPAGGIADRRARARVDGERAGAARLVQGRAGDRGGPARQALGRDPRRQPT